MAEIPIAAAFLAISLVLASVVLSKYADEERSLLWLSFAAHEVGAILNVVVVGSFYGWGDLLGYHRMGVFLANKMRDDFLGLAPQLVTVLFQQAEPLPFPGVAVSSNTGSMQALSGFLCLLCNDSVYAICLVIAFASFLAKLGLYEVFKEQLRDVSRPLLIGAIMLIPSAVFWSTGLLKEPIAVVGLGAMVYGGHAMAIRGRYVSGAGFLVGGALLAGLFKGYLLPPFGIGAAMFFASRALFASGRSIQPRFLLLGAFVATTSIIVTGTALPHFAPDTFEDEALAAQAVGHRTQGGSNFSIGGGPLWSQVPMALATVLYRPFVFEASNVLVFSNSLEMLVAVALTFMALTRSSLSKTIRFIVQRPAMCFCIGFVLTLSIGVGLTTTNMGTLSRYRMPLVPFYATWLAVLASRGTQYIAKQALPRAASIKVAG